MSIVRFRPASVVAAKLIPWEPGIPGIWFRYADGREFAGDARVKTPDILTAIRRLTDAEQGELERLLEAGRAADRP